MQSFLTKLALAGILLLGSASVMAKGSAAAGETKSQTCVACHGADGNGIDETYPRLAGQHQSYLARALLDYQSGKRSNAIMASFVANLTEQDIEDLAAYYASLEGLQDLSIK